MPRSKTTHKYDHPPARYAQTVADEVMEIERMLHERGLRLPVNVVTPHLRSAKASLVTASRLKLFAATTAPGSNGQLGSSNKTNARGASSPAVQAATRKADQLLAALAAARHHVRAVRLTPEFPQRWQLTDAVAPSGHNTRTAPNLQAPVVALQQQVGRWLWSGLWLWWWLWLLLVVVLVGPKTISVCVVRCLVSFQIRRAYLAHSVTAPCVLHACMSWYRVWSVGCRRP